MARENLFTKGLCCLLQLFLKIPVFLVLGLIFVDWYNFVIIYGFGRSHENFIATVFLEIVFNILVTLLVASYLKTVFTSSAVCDNPPPPGYYEELQSRTNVAQRVCLKCEGQPFKPYRSHHCSVCRKCILKMDHHCPWVSNCVGFRNYKFFVLFLFYAVLSCSVYLIFGFKLLIVMFDPENRQAQEEDTGFASILASIMTAAFAVTLFCFVIFHFHLVLSGQTTIEMGLARNGLIRTQNTKKRQNWELVFGTNPWLWFLPVHSTSHSGYEFEPGSEDEDSSPMGSETSGLLHSVRMLQGDSSNVKLGIVVEGHRANAPMGMLTDNGPRV